MEIGEIINSTFKTPFQKAIINLRFTSNYVGNIQNGFMSKYDLSMAQFNILRILRGAKTAISVNTVKDRMIEKSPNTTRLMDKLIDKKLINRMRCDKDRRVLYVEISEDGLDLLSKIDHEIDNESPLDFSGNLSAEEAEQLSNLLDKLRG
jgi:DNA-binding MarR family transcriptional regulator